MENKYDKYLEEALELHKKEINTVKISKILHKKYNLKCKVNTLRVGLSYVMNKYIKSGKKQPNKKIEAQPFVLSAWNTETGLMMDVDEYCEFYKLPRTDIHSYKLVSHTGTPFYNILFKENIEITKDLTAEFIEASILKHIKAVELPIIKKLQTTLIDRVIYTDTHIGMEPNKSGYSLYGGKWGETELNYQLKIMVDHILSEKRGNILIVDELGDFLDGWDGKTVRKGHDLPQNMDNQQMFDVGLAFKVKMIDMLIQHYSSIVVNNICEDNHAGAFGYVVNSAFKQLVELKYDNVSVTNHRKFINHYFYGRHCKVISHGKDSHALKFGFKPHLDPKQIEKIDQYLKQNSIYKKADYIEFCKGDSHQALFDYCTSDDFDYMNYMAFSPSSEWIQTNFKKGRSGFVLEHFNPETNYRVSNPFFFENKPLID